MNTLLAPLLARTPLAMALLSLAGATILSSSPLAAGEADGTYKILRISSFFQQNGEPYKVPQKEVKEALFGSDGITITDNRMAVYQTSLFQDLKDPELREIINTVEITGPRKILLTLSEDGVYRGRTDNPLVAQFSFDFLGSPIPINMRVRSRAKVEGNKLIVIMPIRAALKDGDPETEDLIITGTVRIVAERP